MTNYRSDQESKVELFLHYLSIASRYYKAIPIEGQISEDSISTSTPSSSFKIHWQERLTMHYRIIPLDDAKFTKSDCPFHTDNDTTNRNTELEMNFLCIENAYTKFKVRTCHVNSLRV